MRRSGVRLLTGAVALALASSGAWAAPVADGKWDDWFVNSALQGGTIVYFNGSPYGNTQQGAQEWSDQSGNLQTGVSYADDAAPGGDTLTNGAFPMQLYDIESAVSMLVNNGGGSYTLYFGLVTGMNQDAIGTNNMPGGPHWNGDVFMTTTAGTYAFGVTDGGNGDGGAGNDREGDVYSGITSTQGVNTTLSEANPWRVATATSVLDSAATVAWGSGTTTSELVPLSAGVGGATVGSHNFLEVSWTFTNAALATALTTGNVDWHWTMRCGNDELDWQQTGGYNPGPPPPVPEPASFVLLGIGLAAYGFRKRFTAV
jgi:hypothetical protein